MQLTIEVSKEVAEWLDITAALESDPPDAQPRNVVTKAQIAGELLQRAFEAARDADEIPYLPQPKIGPVEDPLF